MQDKKTSGAKARDYDLWIIILIVCIVIALVIWLFVSPGAMTAISDAANAFAANITWFFLLVPVAMIVVALIIAFGPVGKIRMGGPNATPKYSFYSYWGMLWCAGFGSATVVLSFLDWVDIVQAPPLGIEALSNEAYRFSTAQSMFDWGLTTCALNLFLAIPFCYCFYVRKKNAARLGDVFATMAPGKVPEWVVKLFNFIFIFVVLGGMTTTLGYGIPKLTACICALTGATNTNIINVVMMVVLAVIFTGSASLGIAKGVQNLTRINMIILYIFLGVTIILGQTIFILDNFVQSFGLMVDNWFSMATATEPLLDYSYGEGQTLFCYCYSMAYVAMMAGFMITISYGRTFKEMIMSCLVCIPVGVWVMFAINGGMGMKMQLDGKLDLLAIYNEEGSTAAAIATVQNSPLGPILGVIAFGLMMLIFVETAMDGTSVVLAQATMKKVAVGKEPSFPIKFIWCIILAAIPLVMDAMGAELWLFEAVANVTGWPVLVIGIILWIFLYKWIKQDKGIEYGPGSKQDLESEAGKAEAALVAAREAEGKEPELTD